MEELITLWIGFSLLALPFSYLYIAIVGVSAKHAGESLKRGWWVLPALAVIGGPLTLVVCLVWVGFKIRSYFRNRKLWSRG